MPAPENSYFVRHGESVRNFITWLFQNGREEEARQLLEKMRNVHTSHARLTKKGVLQAKIAGDWFKKESPVLRKFLSSDYVRARETAGHLSLPNAHWHIEPLLGERSHGELENLSLEERIEKYSAAMKLREMHAYHAGIPGGESMMVVVMRAILVLDTLHRELSDNDTVAVLHGETMWALRMRLERISPNKFRKLLRSENPHDKIHNCHILHYSRRNPHSGELEPHLNWMRSICPWDMSLSSNDWQKIVRPWYTNEQMIKRAERYKRYVDEDE